ncbi:helix-turn-helix transcriptional regulator [Nonomuraea sp. NPDC023979]|uniref:helix-turn-helix domain-containing protein n=1 Tax=Nonomuraea sp. NPDC023979 TaxID=3154796 RepID=UPI003408DE6F
MDSIQEWLTQPEGIATRLRIMRAQADLSGKDLADAHGWAQSKVSRIETGKQLPSPEDIRAWVETCGGTAETLAELVTMREEAQVVHATFKARVRHGQKEVQESYNDLVRHSRLVQHFETIFIPGLLQVPAYAKRVLAEMKWLHGMEIDDVDAAVAARMQRQQMIYDEGKEFEFLIAESALHTLVCSPAVMRSQLDRLQTVIGLNQVRFGILPMHVELDIIPQNSFQIYVREDGPVAIVESFLSEHRYFDEKAETYSRVLERLWANAITGDDARDLLLAAAVALPT